MVVAECMAGGIPFLASRVGGTAELVHEDDRGFSLVPPRAQAFAEAFYRAVTDGQRAARPRTPMQGLRERVIQLLAQPRPADMVARDRTPIVAKCRSQLTQGAGLGARPVVTVIVDAVSGSYTNARAVAHAAASAFAPVKASDYPPQAAEVIVIHEASDDKAFSPPAPSTVRTVSVPKGTTPAAAKNEASKHASGEWVLFAPLEAVLQPSAMQHLLQVACVSEADIVAAAPSTASRASTAAWVRRGEWRKPTFNLTPGGPVIAAALQDVFGASLLLVRSSAFRALTYTTADADLSAAMRSSLPFGFVDGMPALEHWELVTRASQRGLAVEFATQPTHTLPAGRQQAVSSGQAANDAYAYPARMQILRALNNESAALEGDSTSAFAADQHVSVSLRLLHGMGSR